MDLGLQGKAAIVAASSRGIGKAVAARLAEEGADVIVASRTPEAIEAAAAEMRRGAKGRVVAMAADVTSPADCAALVEGAQRHFGRVDILVNNAGGPPLGPIMQFEEEDWLNAFRLNFLSTLRLSRGVVPIMQQQGGGAIVNIVSYVVRQPAMLLALSNGIRAGVIGMARSLANEMGPHGIRVNNVLPGRIATERVVQIDHARAQREGKSYDEIVTDWDRRIPLGRSGQPGEVGDLVAFLASSRASYLTGLSVLIDGGLVQGLM